MKNIKTSVVSLGKKKYCPATALQLEKSSLQVSDSDTTKVLCNNIEAFVFYYHPDHLGSSSYITDANGEVTQHIEYFAFGETFLEEHSNTDATPYLFNGKELDEETGLYYYGERYYDAKKNVCQSVIWR